MRLWVGAAVCALLAAVWSVSVSIPASAQQHKRGHVRVATKEPAALLDPEAGSDSGSSPADEHPLAGPLRDALNAKVAQRLSEADKGDRAAIAAVSQMRFGAPIWVTPKGYSPKAVSVIAELRKADDWGLDPAEFAVPELAEARADGPDLDASALADAEVKLSLAVLKYARHARGGRIIEPSKQLSSYLDRQPQLLDPKGVLEGISNMVDAATYLHDLNPRHPQFEKLRQQYIAMRDAGMGKELARIPNGKSIRRGEQSEQIALIRERLKLAANVPDAADPTLYDDDLAKAIIAFQSERGIRAKDGVITNTTRRALNELEAPNPKKLLANMEEWRWMPDDLGDTYVMVNVPEFTVRVFRNGEVVHSERVVVGQTDKQTPIFSKDLETIYFHPRWNVPDSIKVRELWPSLARGGSYFSRQGLRLSRNGREINPRSVNWGAADIRNYDVYQPPGPGNVLGVVKFTFPNKHAVYMHDTPTKPLFNESVRTFSHGCVRVRNPVRLAEVLLAADKGWDQARVDSIVDGPRDETPVKLEHHIPVHVVYFTAWVDDDGKVQTWRDIYGHEKRIMLALDGKFDQIVVGRDHLAPVQISANIRNQIAQSRKPKDPVTDIFDAIFGGF
jgi:murein L,D-transpeptidase YcbB/YkuD